VAPATALPEPIGVLRLVLVALGRALFRRGRRERIGP
jgi:hypothetical protein